MNAKRRRLLIVSNRLPLTLQMSDGDIDVRPSAGGLATGLAGVHEQLDSLWIGWPGETPDDDATREVIAREVGRVRAAPVWLDASDFESFYDGFSNGVLWPLYHYLTDRIDRQAWTHWEAYVRVNAQYADAVARRYQEGDLIWIHDYQLSLLPRMVRERLPGARIGYFLHIPFPSAEVFRVLPWRRPILDGMLGADLIGFHTTSYRRHFVHAAQAFGASCDDVEVGVFPMGIDARAFDDLARSTGVAAELEKLRPSDGRRLILGVDRLDYTKGLQRRLLAFEELLARQPELAEQVMMLQIVVPSRTSLSSYDAYKRELEELVGKLNGRFSSLRSESVRYLFQSVSRDELVALYRAADIMFVTPLRDGMNLVAKEFCASRFDEDGVLVLSELAGATDQMREALLVNPYDIDGVANALRDALDMPREARRARMRALRAGVFEQDAFRWASEFVDALLGADEPAAEAGRSREVPAASL